MPAQYKTHEEATEFANSEQGVEYAMRKMQEVGAGGLSGLPAIQVIVNKFERPRKDLREGEIQGAFRWYQGQDGEVPRSR